MANLPDYIAVFDTETTGIDVEEARIVTAFVGLMSPDGSMTAEQSWTINPGIDMPESATAINGITTEYLQENGLDSAYSILQIVLALKGYQDQGIPLVAYNAAFDFTILKNEAIRHGIDILEPTMVIDGYVIDKKLNKWRKGKRTLTVVAAAYGITVENAHEARADCVMAGKLAFKQMAAINRTPQDIHDRSVNYARDQAASLQTHFRKTDESAIVDGSWPIRAAKKGE